MTYSDHELFTLRNEKASAAYCCYTCKLHPSYNHMLLSCVLSSLQKGKLHCFADVQVFDGGWNTVNSGYQEHLAIRCIIIILWMLVSWYIASLSSACAFNKVCNSEKSSENHGDNHKEGYKPRGRAFLNLQRNISCSCLAAVLLYDQCLHKACLVLISYQIHNSSSRAT